jgi:hypothetical protein
VSRRPVAVLACLIGFLLGGCTNIGAVPGPSADQLSAAWIPPKTISAPVARLEDVRPQRRVRMLSLDEIATVPGRLGEASAGTPMFDVAVLDFGFADTYHNPVAGIERPPQGHRVLFILVRATNVSQVRGRPPSMLSSQGTTTLRGCAIALGGRDPYEIMREVLPDETVEGWLCLFVPVSVQAHEISVTTGRRDQVTWRLNRLAGVSR